MAIDFKRIFKNILGTVALPIGMFIIFFILTRSLGINIYGNRDSFISIMQNTIYSVFVAYGVSLTFKSGMMDFSIGSVVMLASIFAYNVTVKLDGSAWMLLGMCIIFSIILSTIMGSLYVLLKLPIVMVSLGITIIYEAMTGVIFGAEGANAYSIQKFTVFSREPLMYILLIGVMLFYYVFITHTKISYKSRALAFNQITAVNIGIKEIPNVLIKYLVSGVLLGFATVMYVTQTRVVPATSFSSTMVMFMNLFPVIIGLYLGKFCNDTLGIFSGALTVSLFNYGLSALGLNTSLATIYYGLFMILFIGYSTNEEKIIMWIKNVRIRVAKEKRV